MEQKQLHEKGIVDYDYKNDILFFKVKEREYKQSIDFGDFILDVDKEGFVTGIQIFDASKIFSIDKYALQKIRNWRFHTKTENKVVSVQLFFEAVKRNKVLVEGRQNLVRESTAQLKDSEVICKIH
ncbi:DUF2283 domain-containing protein [Candidatus Woesearchaeota archaeon]|nr:DUF2283 domain-containing protein [Candidatus Woesearchaeota archaeon]